MNSGSEDKTPKKIVERGYDKAAYEYAQMEGEIDDLSHMDGIQPGSALENTMLNNR